ncbi:MAG: LPS export ABC transporter periplasmic protein LptC [Pikeienuella sp.]
MLNRAKQLRLFRGVLLVVAAVMAAAVFWLSNQGYEEDGLSVSGVEFDGFEEGMRLTNPEFTGETAKGEPFIVKAEWARPDGPRPKIVDLSEPSGEIHLSNGQIVTLSANSGTLRMKTKTISVLGDVRILRSDGYVLTANAAELDVKEGALRANGDVNVQTPLGPVSAGSMRMTQDDQATGQGYIWFENRVRLRIEQPNMAQK